MIHPAPLLRSMVVAIAILAPLAVSQTVLIVDAAGGPGAQFTDLPAAIAAAPEGATLLVRPGLYSPFEIVGKALSILGDAAGGTVISQNGIETGVRDTTAAQTVLLQSLTFQGNRVFPVTIAIANTSGPVVLDAVTSEAAPVPADPVSLFIANAANVQLHRCRFDDPVRGRNARVSIQSSTVHISDTTVVGIEPRSGTTNGGDGYPGLQIAQSRVLAWRSTIAGGLGGQCCLFGIAPGFTQGRGGPGILALGGAQLTLLRTAVSGGSGLSPFHSPFGPPTIPATAGGAGLDAQLGATARIEGTVPLGGLGGGGTDRPTDRRGGSTANVDPTTFPPAGQLVGIPTAGNTVLFQLEALPGSAGVLLVSGSAALLPLEPFAPGSLLAGIVVSLPTPVVPPSGIADIALSLGAVPPGSWFFAQFASLDPAPVRLWVSNAFPFAIS